MQLILGFLVLFSFTSEAKLSEGMTKVLPITHVQDNDYLHFENFRTRPRAPIAGGIRINGERVRSMEEIFAIFSEEVAAVLPEGTTIKESKTEDGKLVWRYPIGTRVIHQLNFKDDKKSLFELRMIERVSDKRWAYGVYHPINGQLELANYTGHKDREFNLKMPNGKQTHVKLHHIPLHVCQNCHNRTTSAPHQYESLEDVGPCEFTPSNPKVKNDWVQGFVRAFGRQPVVQAK